MGKLETMMKLELDHFFILVEPEAKVANLLVELGLEESYSRLHAGQGTSNRCFKFSNSMMELLWLRDEYEAEKGPAAGLKFPQRSSNQEASPFGLIFNRTANTEESHDSEMPFIGWSYQPDYFPVPNAFHIGSNSENLMEPLCIYVPFMEPVKRELVQGRFKSIKHVHLHVPVKSLSQELLLASQADGLSIECGGEHLLEVSFVGSNSEEACGLSKDFRPELPLILHW